MVEPRQDSPHPWSRFTIGILIMVVGVALLLASLDVTVPWQLVLPGAVITVGVILLVAPSSSFRGGLIALGTVLTVVLAVSLTIDLPVGAGGVRSTEREDFTVSVPVETILVEVDSGSVEVLAGGETVEVRRDLHFGADRPSVGHEIDGGVLRITSDCPRGFLSRCRVDHILSVPAPVSVSVETGSGSIDVDGLTGTVNVHSGSGRIRLSRLAGPVTADASSGSIGLDGLAGNVDVRTGSGSISGGGITSETFSGNAGSGSITLEFDAPPDRLDLGTGSGSVRVTVPQGAYRLDLRSSSGSTDASGITDDASAAHSIVIRTGSGSVRVTGS